jgi:hypothetical protein
MEMGAVVETSSHPINGKQVEDGHECRLEIQSFLLDNFPAKHITEVSSHLT